MKDFISLSPLRLVEKSSRKGLGPGNLGVLMARAGVGKTACLIHIAFDKLFNQEKLVHVSLEDGPEKVKSYYNVIFNDVVKALELPDEYDHRLVIEKNRMILAYLNQSFQTDRLRANLTNLSASVAFKPGALIIDGLDFETARRNLFEELKALAEEFKVEIWFSALTHRHITEVNEKGIPYPCLHLDDLFSLIVLLEPEPSGVFLKLLKDHDNPTLPDTCVKLDPNTFLLSGNP